MSTITSTYAGTRVDVDAAALQLGARDIHQITSAKALSELGEASPLGLGVLKRMLAAFRSASTRGGVTFTATPVGQMWYEENGVATDASVRMRLVVTSDGGVWSSRQYKMVTVVTISQDEYGVHSWGAGRGVVCVTGRDGQDRTLFAGRSVGQMIGSLHLGRGLARNMIADTIREATAKPAPAWHTTARRQIAELAACDSDKDERVRALICIAGATQDQIVTAVTNLTRYDTETLQAATAAEELLVDDPHDWAIDLLPLLSLYERRHLADTIVDRLVDER